MEVFQPLVDFYEVVTEDGRISPSHISLYMALLYRWNLAGGENPIVISRDGVMKSAKISARHTYNKCMRELHCYGYIKYRPSSHPLEGSMVSINPCKQEQ
jgi:hypothetical protein